MAKKSTGFRFLREENISLNARLRKDENKATKTNKQKNLEKSPDN